MISYHDDLLGQLCRFYAVDSIRAVILSSDPQPLAVHVAEGMMTEDQKIHQRIYQHVDAWVQRRIYIPAPQLTLLPSSLAEQVQIIPFIPPEEDKLDFLLYDPEEGSAEDLTYWMERVRGNILVTSRHQSYVDKLDLTDWRIRPEQIGCLLEYWPIEVPEQVPMRLYTFFELVHLAHLLFTQFQIPYTLIRSSCLGAVRNRGHLFYEDEIHLAILQSTFQALEDPELQATLKQWQVQLQLEGNSASFTLQPENSPSGRIHLYRTKTRTDAQKYEIWDGDQVVETITFEELGELKEYPYGPMRTYSLQHPESYLDRTFGPEWKYKMKIEGTTLYHPKILYDSVWNSWSPYTSRYWKRAQIQRTVQVGKELTKAKIRWWVDCGTILGAVRNNHVCIFDDDVDIGVFGKNKPKTRLKISSRFGSEEYPWVNRDLLEKVYHEKEEANYNITSARIYTFSFRLYKGMGHKYASEVDHKVAQFHGIPGLLEKRAVDKKYFALALTQCYIEGELLNAPYEPFEYVESTPRYGKGSVLGGPKRDVKPGRNETLYDNEEVKEKHTS